MKILSHFSNSDVHKMYARCVFGIQIYKLNTDWFIPLILFIKAELMSIH